MPEGEEEAEEQSPPDAINAAFVCRLLGKITNKGLVWWLVVGVGVWVL